MVIVAGVHADFVRCTTFQPAALAASSSSAGCHWSACESPNSTTVRVPAGSPYTHGWTGASAMRSAWQPSAREAGRSALAASISGVRFAGAGPPSIDSWITGARLAPDSLGDGGDVRPAPRAAHRPGRPARRPAIRARTADTAKPSDRPSPGDASARREPDRVLHEPQRDRGKEQGGRRGQEQDRAGRRQAEGGGQQRQGRPVPQVPPVGQAADGGQRPQARGPAPTPRPRRGGTGGDDRRGPAAPAARRRTRGTPSRCRR